MSDVGYIEVVNFEKFQHYKQRNPPWIKLHAMILDNYEYARLQDASKAHLVGLWILASKHGNRIPADPQWIGQRIGATSPIDVEALIAAGFIKRLRRASDVQAPREQNHLPETETETEGETEKSSSPSETGKPADEIAVVFWQKVERTDGCWVWRGATRPDGYGVFKYRNRLESAHRLSYWISSGVNPGEMLVLHSCDNRICVNPEHLRLGTHRDNARDIAERGQSSRYTITAEQVSEIRRRSAGGEGMRSIADAFGIGQSTVSRIVNGHARQEVPMHAEPPADRADESADEAPPAPPTSLRSVPPDESGLAHGEFMAAMRKVCSGRKDQVTEADMTQIGSIAKRFLDRGWRRADIYRAAVGWRAKIDRSEVPHIPAGSKFTLAKLYDKDPTVDPVQVGLDAYHADAKAKPPPAGKRGGVTAVGEMDFVERFAKGQPRQEPPQRGAA